MTPVWNPAENKSKSYQEVHRHSDGMISLSCEMPDSTRLKGKLFTKAFQELVESSPEK